MFRDYKIYYNDSFVLLTENREQSNKNFSKVISGMAECSNFFKSPDLLYDPQSEGNILLCCEKPGQVMCDFLEHTNVMIAGGGIVWNEKDELLLIFRRGKWDLPKGKIELQEKIKDGAVREVEEETGVKVESVLSDAVRTYHVYTLKGIRWLKETSWFEMKAVPGQHQLTPQTEEDIEEVRWVSKTELLNYKAGCYPLIWDLLSKYTKE